jgi:thiamine biosynthesis protein ThiI
MAPIVLVHHHEIALKGQNRSFFENKLIENIKKKTGLKKATKDAGRIILKVKSQGTPQLKKGLKAVFGIANFAFAHEEELSLPKIRQTVLRLIKGKKFSSFRISARRGNKNFPLSSLEINQKLGREVVLKTGAKVSLEKPTLEIFIEIGQKKAYVYFKKIKGPGGLPIGSAGQLLCLISGGIDSPVAAYQLLKRGARVDFVHFHSYPHTDQASIEKTKRLVKTLNRFQFQSNLYLCPFLSFQKQAFKKTAPRFLVILYRRAMLRLAQEIAQKEACLGLITGESLGQVASQTLQNLAVTNQSVKIPIYRPLIGFDKEEIIALARQTGSYQISIEPHQDCCSLFVPRHPATAALLESVLKEEEKLEIEKLISEILSKTKKLMINKT